MPTNFDTGVTNSKASDFFGNLIHLDPTKSHVYMNDFDHFVAGDWTFTKTGAGTTALTNVDGGALLITNAAADDDAVFGQKVGESFKFVSNKKLFYKTRFKVSDATQSDLIMGLIITDTTPLANSDGVYFSKADGSASVSFSVNKNGTATTKTSVATLVADTFVELAFYYNGVDAIEYAVNGVKIGTAAVTNLPDDEDLTITFGIQNGEAVAKTMTIDYIFVSKER
jgi:hypothetical protein